MDSNFKLLTFRNEVSADFNKLKKAFAIASVHSRGYDSIENLGNKESSSSKNSLLSKVFFKIIFLLGKRLTNYLDTNPNYIAKEARAVAIINDPEIKRTLCLTFQQEIKSNLTPKERETRIIEIMTTLLTDEKISQLTVVEKTDVRLFSIIIFKMCRQDLKSFCK